MSNAELVIAPLIYLNVAESTKSLHSSAEYRPILIFSQLLRREGNDFIRSAIRFGNSTVEALAYNLTENGGMNLNLFVRYSIQWGGKKSRGTFNSEAAERDGHDNPVAGNRLS